MSIFSLRGLNSQSLILPSHQGFGKHVCHVLSGERRRSLTRQAGIKNLSPTQCQEESVAVGAAQGLRSIMQGVCSVVHNKPLLG